MAYAATQNTEDADCVVRREGENLDRLASALRDLHARLRVSGMSDEDPPSPGPTRWSHAGRGGHLDLDDRRGSVRRTVGTTGHESGHPPTR